MDQEEALAEIARVDRREHAGRAERLVELLALLDGAALASSDQAADWLFDDVKGTWIHGFFASTVVCADAFCRRQLAGILAMASDSTVPEYQMSLEQIASRAAAIGAIDSSLHAQLTLLSDAAAVYIAVSLDVADRRLEQRLDDLELVGSSDHLLLEDARRALVCSVAVLH